MIFGDNVLVGWDVRILDSDNHTVFGRDGEKSTNEKTIKILKNHLGFDTLFPPKGIYT